jgi:hypothetical protein
MPRKNKKLFSIYRSRDLRAAEVGAETASNEMKYFTSMHYYKRDLTPVKEIFAQCSEKLPYRDNFQNYEGSLMSASLKDDLLKGLGDGVRCVT